MAACRSARCGVCAPLLHSLDTCMRSCSVKAGQRLFPEELSASAHLQAPVDRVLFASIKDQVRQHCQPLPPVVLPTDGLQSMPWAEQPSQPSSDSAPMGTAIIESPGATSQLVSSRCKLCSPSAERVGPDSSICLTFS